MQYLIGLILTLTLTQSGGFIVTDRAEPTFVVDQPAADFVVTETPEANPWFPTPPPKPDPRPVIIGYSTSWCQLCPTAKDALEKAAKELPFQLRWQDVTNAGAPPWCDAFPAFSWTGANNQTWYVKGWVGVKELVGRWHKTRAPPVASVNPEIESLSPELRTQLEAALKAGYTLDQIRRYALRHGLIKR